MAKKKLNYLASAIAAITGFVMLLTLTFMHQPPGQKAGKEISKVQFDVKQKKQQQKIVKKKPAPKKQTNQAKSLKPRLDLAFASGGLDLGIDILGLSAKDSGLLNQGDAVMTEDVVDRLPQVQYREAIPYPDSAKDQNIAGYVTVNLLVSNEGKVEKVKLVDANPEGIFEQAALEGVKSWTFSPAEYQGRMVSVWVKQKIKFQVN